MQGIKRRKAKDNPYVIDFSNEKDTYVLYFKDGLNQKQEISISRKIYEEFNRFELEDISQMNKYDRHIEHSNIIEPTLSKRSFFKQISVEDIVINKIKREDLYKAINRLPKIQKKRIYMYYFQELNQKKIAEIENCSIRAIQYSIENAIKNLKKFLN